MVPLFVVLSEPWDSRSASHLLACSHVSRSGQQNLSSGHVGWKGMKSYLQSPRVPSLHWPAAFLHVLDKCLLLPQPPRPHRRCEGRAELAATSVKLPWKSGAPGTNSPPQGDGSLPPTWSLKVPICSRKATLISAHSDRKCPHPTHLQPSSLFDICREIDLYYCSVEGTRGRVGRVRKCVSPSHLGPAAPGPVSQTWKPCFPDFLSLLPSLCSEKGLAAAPL